MKTKYFIVSEEELRRVAANVVVGDWIDKYIKSKKSVEEIDSGEVTGFSIDSGKTYSGVYLRGEKGNNFLYMSNDIALKIQGKPIKIWIEEG